MSWNPYSEGKVPYCSKCGTPMRFLVTLRPMCHCGLGLGFDKMLALSSPGCLYVWNEVSA